MAERIFGAVPTNYPVRPEWIPDMPLESFHLNAFGRVTPDDCERYGWRAMRCASCEERSLTLIWLHPALGADYYSPEQVAKRGKRQRTIPGTVWGKDVLALCSCCSVSTCPHCWFHGEIVIGHDLNEHGTCRRCERSGLKAVA